MTYKVPKNNAYSTLASGIDDVALSLTVATGEGARFPSTYPFHITIDSEILECTNRAVDTLTVTRAAESTSADSHLAGANVRLNITAEAITELQTAAPEGHAAAGLSSTVHPSTAIAKAYPNASVLLCPTFKYARVELNTAVYDLATPDNWEFTDLYPLATTVASGGGATQIIDADVSPVFTTANCRYARVDWTDGAGANPGSGYVTARVSDTELTIYKTSGADFVGNTGKYHITKAWYKVLTAGYYAVVGSVYFAATNMVDQKSLFASILVNGAVVTEAALHSSGTSYLAVTVPSQFHCAANDQIALAGWHNTGANNITIYGNTPAQCFLAVAMIQGD